MIVKFIEELASFIREEEAATAVEYAVMVVFIVLAVVVVVEVLGEKTSNSFNKLNNKFTP